MSFPFAFFKLGSLPCTNQRESWTNFGTFWGNTTYTYNAHPFVASVSATMCKAQVSLRRTGTAPGTVKVAIYSDSAGSPNVQIGTASDTVSCSTIGTSAALVDFPNLSATLVSGTTYWFVIIFSAVGTDASNKVETEYGFASGNQIKVSTNGTVWAPLDFGFFKSKLFST